LQPVRHGHRAVEVGDQRHHQVRLRQPAAARLELSRQAPLAGRPFAHRQTRGGADPRLRLRRDRFFNSDGPRREIEARRRSGFARLDRLYARRFERSAAHGRGGARGLSDLQFTGSYRVPFQYSPYAAQAPADRQLRASSSGATVRTSTAISSTT
jgi:glutamate-1-semialdehyde 2,1-aminomutase